MNDAAMRRRAEVAEVDIRLQQQYENRLADALQQIRDENSDIIKRNREELDAHYDKRVHIYFLAVAFNMFLLMQSLIFQSHAACL